MELIFILSSVVFILATLYYLLTWNYNFWQKQGIPCTQTTIPGLGNIASVLFLRQSFAALCEKYYNENENHSMFGFYQLTTPTLLVRDPELVKSVLLTNFSSFQENQFQISCPKSDALFAINPFFSRSDTWKDNRAPLSKAFSSKNLKSMFPLIRTVAFKMEDYLRRKINFQSGKLELELKQFFNLYTGEVAAAGIGIQGLDFQDDNKFTENEWSYKTIIEKIFASPIFSGGIIQTIVIFIPRLAKLLNLSIIPKDVDLFFRQTEKIVRANRSRDNKSYNDFLQIIIDYQEVNGPKVDKETELASHMFSFMIEVYETSAITLSFMAFQLAVHPEIQEKVREEVKMVLENCNGKLEYEVLKDMTYLDQVLNESTRLNHVLGAMMKICTKEIQLVGSDGLSCKMKPGNFAVISTTGLQMDPKYWPDPERFDPERFNKEWKESRPKFAFIPFGEGPRICVGIRMANMIIKMAIATILKHYSLEVSSKISSPLKRNERSFLNTFEQGLWVVLKPLK